MVFSSLFFIFGFLPVTLLLYLAVPHRFRNHVALAASGFFYAWGAPRFLFVLLASCALDYLAARGMTDPNAAPRRRPRLLMAALIYNLGLLIYFKYSNFLVDDVNALLGALGVRSFSWTKVALPIGISFFTFHKISYLVDVYRGTAHRATSFGTYLLYILLFPQLIAGPIIRYHDIAEQLVRRAVRSEQFFSGIRRFCTGLAKKVLVANTLATVADRAFAADAAGLPPLQAWIGILCYSFQIYFDFSGYSDMAIGLARMMGFEFLENFNRPYISRNFTEFWRRWHISLSNFMREYLYIPLGGNRVSPARQYVNLWIVFLLSGFWHGAAWNFIVWGAFHGFFLTVDKFHKARGWKPWPAWLAIPGNFVLVMIGWVFFRADTLSAAVRYLRCMALPNSGPPSLTLSAFLPAHVAVALAVAAVICFLPACGGLRRESPAPATRRGVVWQGLAALLLLFFSTCALAAGGFNPFIYFRF